MRQDGYTPLYISACNGHTDTVRALLEAGATVDAKMQVRGALLSECMCVCLRIRKNKNSGRMYDAAVD